MTLLILLATFFKIGLFSFGGGYAMIPLLQAEIGATKWISMREFADIVAVSQMTPGPLAVNAATYIGYKVGGIAGAAAATLGVFLPSFILTLTVALFLRRFQQNQIIDAALKGIRPATIGLIGAAVVFFAEFSIFSGPLHLESLGTYLFGTGELAVKFGINAGGLTIGILIFAASRWLKVHPIAAILASACLGLLLL